MNKSLSLEEKFKSAVQNHQKNNLEVAINLYKEILETDPNNSTIHYNLGLAYNEKQHLNEAISCYKKVIEIDPNYISAHFNLGLIYKDLGDLEKEISCYEKTISINPNHSKAKNNLGLAFKKLGEYSKAKSFYEEAIKIDPNLVEAHNNLGTIFSELGETNKAIKSYENAIKINPDLEFTNNNLGKIYKEIGEQKKSVDFFQKSLINRSKIDFDLEKKEENNLNPATTDFFLELTNKCNFHCEFCPSDSQTRHQGYMELSLVEKILNEISEKNLVPKVNLHLMGEPTLHPKLNDILNYAKQKNVKIALTTNGSTMVKKKVPQLLDSIYGEIVASLMTPTQDTYKIRGDVGLSWERYVDNFRLLIREHLKKILRGDKIEYEIIFRVMVSNESEKGTVKVLDSSKSIQENYDEWSNFTEIVEKELGLKSFPRQTIDPNTIIDILGGNTGEISFYLQKNIKIQFWRAFTFANSRVKDEYKLVPQEKTQYCPHPFTDFGVLWNGDVSLCCLDYDATLKVGNVKDNSVEDVLKNSKSKKLRASMYGLEKLHPTCVKCQSQAIKK